jgi:hypothetical protein
MNGSPAEFMAFCLLLAMAPITLFTVAHIVDRRSGK